MENRPGSFLKWTALLFVVLLLNTAYITAFASPTIFYMGNVLLHLLLGLVLAVMFALLMARRPELRTGVVPATIPFPLSLLAGSLVGGGRNVASNPPLFFAVMGVAPLGPSP